METVSGLSSDEKVLLQGLIAHSADGGLSLDVAYLHQHPRYERIHSLEEYEALLASHKDTRSVIVRRTRSLLNEMFGRRSGPSAEQVVENDAA